jgi:hypothetical protein
MRLKFAGDTTWKVLLLIIRNIPRKLNFVDFLSPIYHDDSFHSPSFDSMLSIENFGTDGDTLGASAIYDQDDDGNGGANSGGTHGTCDRDFDPSDTHSGKYCMPSLPPAAVVVLPRTSLLAKPLNAPRELLNRKGTVSHGNPRMVVFDKSKIR